MDNWYVVQQQTCGDLSIRHVQCGYGEQMRTLLWELRCWMLCLALLGPKRFIVTESLDSI